MDIHAIAAEPFDPRMLRDGAPEERLLLFIDSLLDLLRIGALGRYLLFGEDVRIAWLRAMEEVGDNRIERLRSSIERLREYAGRTDRTLADAGLEGAELDAKLHGYAQARRAFHVYGGIANLKRALRWGKSILGSLTSLLPFAEFLLELIEMLENGAQDVRDMERMQS
jgi:hypothetical protein